MRKHTLKSAGNRSDWLLPILCLFTVTFFVYRDFDIRMLYGYAVLALFLGLHLLRRLRQNNAPALEPPAMALLLLLCTVLVSFLRPDSHHNADTFSFIISMIICTGFVVLSRPTEKAAKLAMGLCLAGAVAVTAFVLFFECNPWYFWNWFLRKLSPTAGNYLCYYVPKGYSFSLGGCTQTDYTLFLGIAVCCAWAVSRRKLDWKSVLALALGGVFLYTIMLVGRRGELLGAAICLVVLVLALCNRKQRRYLLIGGTVTIVVGLALVIVLMPWLKQFPVLYRYLWTLEWGLKGYDITSGRSELFALAWDAFLKNPIFGLGWDNFYQVIPQSFQNLHGQNIVEDAHNIYLQFLAETGILGTPFLLAPILYIYWQVCRQFARLKGCAAALRSAQMLCTVSFLIQTFLLVMGLFDPTFQKIVFWCFYGIALVFQCTAMRLEGYTPDDPASRLLKKFTHLCTRPLVLAWNWAAGLLARLHKI